MFPVITVPTDAADALEPMGSKDKFWYFRDGDRWLFKRTRPGTGEDWSEKVAAELAELLSLPHARYELAEHDGLAGVVTPNFVPEGGLLFHGNEILSRLDPNYPDSGNSRRQYVRVPQHTVERLARANSLTELVRPPMNWNGLFDVQSPAEVVAGYLLLDAWIGNTDRHHENWAWVGTHDDQGNPFFYLAPTFDHASSLGRNESDEKRRRRLDCTDPGFSVQAYVEKCRSALYTDDSDTLPLTTYDAFVEFARRFKMSNLWLLSLEGLSMTDVEDVFRRIPRSRISDTAAEFAMRILEHNRARLLKLRDRL